MDALCLRVVQACNDLQATPTSPPTFLSCQDLEKRVVAEQVLLEFRKSPSIVGSCFSIIGKISNSIRSLEVFSLTFKCCLIHVYFRVLNHSRLYPQPFYAHFLNLTDRLHT